MDKFRIEIKDTVNKEELTPFKGWGLTSEWCKCGNDKFLCYPEDGACTCGVYKHHVHCTCGGVSQVG